MRSPWYLFGLCALVGAASCHATSVQRGPSETLHAYARALESNKADEAYALFSEEARRNVSLEAFRRMVHENPDEMREIARALARPSSDPIVTAEIISKDGESLRLLYEGGRWVIDASVIDRYGQASPRQAVEGFLRALERKRYDLLLRFVPDSHRAGLDASTLRAAFDEGEQAEEVRAIAEALRASLPTASIEEIGDKASVHYGEGKIARLVREDGRWKIEDLD